MRQTDQGKTNFSRTPGKIAILDYKVPLKTRSVHHYAFGCRCPFDGNRKTNGFARRAPTANGPTAANGLQWCQGKSKPWPLDSMQRTEETHCGEAHKNLS